LSTFRYLLIAIQLKFTPFIDIGDVLARTKDQECPTTVKIVGRASDFAIIEKFKENGFVWFVDVVDIIVYNKQFFPFEAECAVRYGIDEMYV
jgi:hypothetical protein